MEKEILTQIATQGVFAALFVWLLWDTRKEARERENKLNNLIDKLADKFNVVEDIKEDVDTIKDHLFNNK
ncbi:BhlA/UviB family holin-like peptide [Clostridium perfringens]|uniref:Putative bacteriocin UviB n=1 Tax=Clostridium perfringens TaxID=1502 RepID=A0A133MPE9_CLOPF|nr:BhlA/UviB family holin-like peptide [Clostridium perfringens]ELC8455672.1 bacteriocin [Clostridium perfringens]KXA05910.1 putative bacteriocin UviB [Clostridium perfringens]MDG6877496.1 Bacteriocin UviB precursor [Clostridium perfringens]MDK0559661.1 BhlA/UviB family holin-like peptide [Clostridium perfringens]MDK0700167.1 BhlA/UviB family holin-like peptide [Clostridium perfringens]